MRGQREHLERWRDGKKSQVDPVVWELAEAQRELTEVAATATLDEFNRERLGRALARIRTAREGLA